MTISLNHDLHVLLTKHVNELVKCLIVKSLKPTIEETLENNKDFIDFFI
jgi:hypothetical protein